MENNPFRLEKTGRKWRVGEYGEEWLFKRVYNRKWKAEVAIEVYKSGGRWRDYCERLREEPYHRRKPVLAMEAIRKANGKVIKLKPTCEEISAYGEHLYETGNSHGTVTETNGEEYFQRIHDTWYQDSKQGGRVHIDLGCNGYHLMLTWETCADFINFVRERRARVRELAWPEDGI